MPPQSHPPPARLPDPVTVTMPNGGERRHAADGGSAASVERRARKNWLIARIGTRQSRSLRRRISHALLPLRRCLTFGLCPRGAFLAGAHGSVIPDKWIGAKSV
jgi:hypothetical protein